MHCPYCGSEHIGIKEHLKDDKKRHQCYDCKKTWTSKTETSKIAKVDFTKEEQKGECVLTTKSANIKTIEDLLKYSKVDLNVWEVDKSVVNSWEVTMGSSKTGTGRPETYTNYQVKAWLKKINAAFDPRKEIKDFLKDASKHSPYYKKIDYKKSSSENLLEISLFDHHFGQLSWGDETGGGHYDIKIAESLAIDAVEKILSDASKYEIDRILLPIGNDFFNVNGALNTTASGTPQSEDDRWKKTFTNGRRLWVKIIEMCMLVAPVDALLIPGNHDEERVYYLGETLYAWFHKCKDVTIDNSPEERKIYEWGKCAIGFTHGNKEVKGSLVNIMATRWPMIWSRTKYREWHKGHLHAARAQAFQILDEEHGVREWVLPSLVAIDDWHAGKGYSALRESMAMIWNKNKGKTNIIMYHDESF